MAKRTTIMLLTCLLMTGWSGYGRGEEASEYALKFALTYKFAKFTDWPSPATDTFHLCAAGVAAYARDLSALDGKTVGKAVVKTRQVSSLEDAMSCHVLFLRMDNASQLHNWLTGLQRKPVLTVADNPVAWDKGAMIALSLESDQIGFSIDASRAKSAGLSVSSQVLALAKLVR